MEAVLYSNENSFADKCFTSQPEASSSSGSKREEYGYVTATAFDTNSGIGETLEVTGGHANSTNNLRTSLLGDFGMPAYSLLETSDSNPWVKGHRILQTPVPSGTINDASVNPSTRTIEMDLPESGTNSLHSSVSIGKRDDETPSLPCILFCPQTGSDISSTSQIDSDIYSDSGSADDATNQLADILNKRIANFEDDHDPQAAGSTNGSSVLYERYNVDYPELNDNFSSQAPEAASSMKVCPGFRIQIPDFSSTSIITYFDLEYPGNIDPTYGRYNPLPLNLGNTRSGSPAFTTPNNRVVYGREHVYEQSMCKLLYT
jgi:hypothetical protein